ncbi:hypothetical protein NDU88_002903 [Pleurodeles waltl]|uniref:Uncharacterized protein n=1 Tax=Pleurodeles waltl TaxID=8319 RepID=A0AAV7UCF4_PLEWA|nr:hypothetical protein NDU88_002903 [Pleurodeles waltl]
MLEAGVRPGRSGALAGGRAQARRECGAGNRPRSTRPDQGYRVELLRQLYPRLHSARPAPACLWCDRGCRSTAVAPIVFGPPTGPGSLLAGTRGRRPEPSRRGRRPARGRRRSPGLDQGSRSPRRHFGNRCGGPGGAHLAGQ